MDKPEDKITERVASVGSPSSNYEVTLDLNKVGRHTPLVGALLGLENPMGDGSELALGTVTEVTTHNRWHEDSAFKGASNEEGTIEGYSGEDGDSRTATIRLQAAWKRSNKNSDWVPSGPNLRMSPATGTKVFRVDDSLISQLTVNTEDLHYMGELGGTDGVRLPFSVPDFSGPAGATHSGFYGISGAGKCLKLDTPIPTPLGWTNMGDLKDGDIVFDDMGRQTTVVKAHDVLYNRECFEVVFSDGSVIVADAEHLWETETIYARARGSLERAGRRKRRRPLNTAKYGDSNFEMMRTSVVYPAEPILVALHAEMSKPARSNNAIRGTVVLERIEAAQKNIQEDQWFTAPDIARILGRPTRNSALIKTLKSLNVPFERRKVAILDDVLAKTVTRYGNEVTVYPKATLLKAIALQGAKTWRDQRDQYLEPVAGVRTTREILNTLKDSRGTANHAVRVAGALDLPYIELPIAPYLLGVWLGDGDSRSGEFCGADHEIAEQVRNEGYTVIEQKLYAGDLERRKNKMYREWKVVDFRAELKKLGLIQATTAEGSQKRIPDIYLRSSIAQRRDLLAGLLDTDGTAGSHGSVEFSNMNENLANQVRELALSLGYRASISKKWVTLKDPKNPDGPRKEYGWGYTVFWTTADTVFRLTRKNKVHDERSKKYNKSKNAYRYITDVRAVPSVPMRCITVDSPSHLYLAGKSMIPTHNTQAVSYYLANQIRHEKMGFIVVDPQGQWSAEQGMVFSLQGFAAEMGRDVLVRRISSDLRLKKDDELFTNLLKHTKLVVELGLKSEATQEIVWYEIGKFLRLREDWTREQPNDLLRDILEYLRSDETAERVYTTPDNRKAFVGRVDNVLGVQGLFSDALHQFSPIHNLFQTTNTLGEERHDLWNTLSEVFERVPNRPAPLLILDMSSAPMPGMDEEITEAVRVAQRILENDSVKAAVLRNLFSTLKRASEDKFRAGVNLNTMVILDEAWRFAAPVNKSNGDELAALSQDLAGYARDTRKFGIGWLYISQSTTSVNLDIWDQMSIRFFGYGLSGADVNKMSEIVDDKNALRLYRTFGNPRSTGIYPFLVTGPVSPLAANATPLTLNTYNDFDEFRRDNNHWISQIRAKLGKPVLLGQPVPPTGSGARPVAKPRIKPVKDLRSELLDSSQEVRENRKSIGMTNTKGFGDPLSGLDDELD